MRIYFSGIGGVALGPLALIARDAGYDVVGSDLVESRYTRLLQDKGVAVSTGQTGDEIAAAHAATPIDWLVATSALPADHPELQFAREHSIRISKRDELINQILADKQLKLIAIAGTHGKTTTTGMVIWLLKELGLPVSHSIGTNISFGPSGHYEPGSQYFVYEADEFDRNFLHFHPYLSIITCIDYDHPDTYPDKADYDQAFHEFAEQSEHIISWQQYAQATPGDTFTFLASSDEHITQITLAGQHNRENAWQAVVAVAQLTTEPIERLIDIINRFPGTERRFEKLADNLYTDYAHHPTEIRAMLQLARELSDHVVVVYQPHQNLRQHEIADQYTDCFSGAERVYWLPTYLSRESHDNILQPAELIAKLADPSIATPAGLDDNLWQQIQSHRKRGDLIMLMGAGSIDEWARGRLEPPFEVRKP